MKVPLLTSVYLAVAITFSSTIIIMKLLSDKKDTETVYGRYTIGLMLVQDVIAVLIMIALVACIACTSRGKLGFSLLAPVAPGAIFLRGRETVLVSIVSLHIC